MKATVICLISIFCLQWGCARSVTNKSVVLTIDIKVTYAGTIDLNRFNYGIAINSTAPNLPSTPTEEILPNPGFIYNESDPILLNHTGQLQYYYEEYFSTWSDYIYLTDHTIGSQLVKSNASNFSANTTQSSVYPPSIQFEHSESYSDSTFHIQFEMDQLSVSPTTLYFKFFVTKKTKYEGITYPTGQVLDISKSQNQFIRVSSQQEVYNTEEQAPSRLNPGSDITAWHIKIY